MRKFLIKLLSFCLLLFGALVPIDYIYSLLIRKSNYRPVEAWEDIVCGNIQSDVIVAGNSRAWIHVDPHILDSILCTNSYNLGIDGSPINRQVQKYNIYRKNNSKPKVIIQNIDYCSLEYRCGYEIEQFFPYFWNKEMRSMFFSTEPFSFGEKYIPLYRYHGMSPVSYTQRIPRTLNKGYQGFDAIWDGEKYMQQKTIKFSVCDTTLCMFDAFLKQTQEDSIKVVFVYAPLFSGATQKIVNIGEMYQTFQNLADRYGIPILDYSDMWVCSDTAYFYNAMHLNKKGSEIYSDSLANGIKRLNLL